jgi:hypothetical protein
LSFEVGMVLEKKVVKIGNSTWSGIAVQVAPDHVEFVSLHNIKKVLS